MKELSLSNTAEITALLHSGAGLPGTMTKDIYLTRQAVVGTRYLGGAEELMDDLEPGSRVTLLHEAENRFDQKAVIVIDEEGRKLGYIPRSQNAVICALLDAGKMFYGVISERPRRTREYDEESPYKFIIDLYMREYMGPEDLKAIPLHGTQGSYAVVSVTVSEDAGQAKHITGICALKIINGEERGLFMRETDKEADKDRITARDARREMLDAFEETAGYLPIVSFGIDGEILEILKEAYGVLLGKPFSNHVIDVRKMAGIHLPGAGEETLEEYADRLGILCDAESGAERSCRLTWKLYCRLERSELEKQSEMKPAEKR